MQFYETSRLILLWLIPLLALLYFWGEKERRRRLARFGEVAFLEKRLIPGFSLSRRCLGAFFLLACVLFAALALARPQWGEEKRQIERKGLDIIFVLDTSLSMLAQDIKPDRLRKAKLEIKNMLRRFQGHRVGMVAFSGTSFLQSPLTLDYSAFLLFVDALKPGFLPNPGTSLSQAIDLALRAFPSGDAKHRAMIILSDGEDHEGGIEQAMESAKKVGIRIYTLGTGTEEGEPIPLRSEQTGKVTGYKKDRQGEVVVTRLGRELLERIARETGGIYFPATPAEKEIDILLKDMETLGERKIKERLITEREDHFQLFVFLALVFLIGEGLWREGRRRPAQAVLALCLFFLFAGLIDTSRSLVEKGNRNIQEKKYQSAVENYRKAQVNRPKEPAIRYNLGTALYQLYEYRDAEKELDQATALAKDPATKAKALYNYGNTQYRLGNFEKAIDAYKKTLELNPKDEDAKYNLEFLQKQKALFEKKQEERKQQQQQNQQSNSQDQQQRSQSQSQQQDQKQQDQNQQSSSQKQPDQERKDQQEQAQQNQEQQESEAPQGQQEEEGQGDEEKKSQEEKEKEEQKAQAGKEEQERREQEQKDKEEKEEQEKEREGRQDEEQDQEKQPRPQTAMDSPKKPLQGQMSQENALRILNALLESEKELQDLRRPPIESDSGEVLKDW